MRPQCVSLNRMIIENYDIGAVKRRYIDDPLIQEVGPGRCAARSAPIVRSRRKSGRHLHRGVL